MKENNIKEISWLTQKFLMRAERTINITRGPIIIRNNIAAKRLIKKKSSI
jgi:hypothetical protein